MGLRTGEPVHDWPRDELANLRVEWSSCNTRPGADQTRGTPVLTGVTILQKSEIFADHAPDRARSRT